jgi:hypothetical protein
MRKSYHFITAVLLTMVSLMVKVDYTRAVSFYIADEFKNTGQIDLEKTDAEIDVQNGWVTLSRRNASCAVTLYEDDYDITLVNGCCVDTYSFNGQEMVRNEKLSVNAGLLDPVSVAAQAYGQYVVIDQGNKKAAFFQFDGYSMVENPLLSVNGLEKPLAASVSRIYADYVVLDINEEFPRVKWYSFSESGLVLNDLLSQELSPDSHPVALSIHNTNFGYALVEKTRSRVHYYSFNGVLLTENPLLCIEDSSLLSKPRSISLHQKDLYYVVVDDNDIKMFCFDGNCMRLNPYMSVYGLNRPLAVALKPGAYEYAVLHYDEKEMPVISYFAFTGTAMERIDGLSISGLEEIPFGNDQMLTGKAVSAAEKVWGLKLQADVEVPQNTSITWEVTNDGGATWLPIVNNGPAVRFDAGGTRPNYRARLHTDNQNITPKIKSVRLIDSSLAINEMQVTAIVGPSIAENPPLPVSFPPCNQVSIWAGHNVTIAVSTTGAAKTMSATIWGGEEIITLDSMSGDFIPANPLDNDDNLWTATFHANVHTPSGTLLDINLSCGNETDAEQLILPGAFIIEGSALHNHPIHLTH